MHHFTSLAARVAPCLLFASIAGTLPAPAIAAGAADAPVIEELVVTARKQPEAFGNVPTALTVVGADELQGIGATRLQDVELRLPNLATNQSPLTGFTSRYVRGMNAGARNIGFESGLGIFIDGVYGGRYAASNRILQSVERIEYLPGPQSTLFGKNTTLGVLNIVTRVPDPVTALDLVLDGGSHGRRGTRVEGVTGFQDWVVWGGVGRQLRDGFERNLPTGQRGNDVDQQDAMLNLAGTLGAINVRIAGDYFESGPDLIARQRLEGFGALPPRRAGNDLDGRLADRDRGLSLHLERELGAGVLTSVTALRRFDTGMTMDDDAWELPVQHLVDWREAQDQVSQELRLRSDAGAIRYLAGLYYQRQETTLERNVESLFGVARVRGALDTDTLAMFGNLASDVGTRLTAEIGVRWTGERKVMPRYSQDGGGVLIDFTERGQRTVSSTTPSASLHYRLTDAASAYLRYARSFKSGGFNVDVVTAPAVTAPAFEDERADTLETGLKARLLEGRLQLNAALFRTRYDDLQVSQYTVLPGAMLPTLRVTNAASATTYGGELGADLLIGRWSLGSRIGYTHGEVDRFPDPLGPGTGDWSGNGLGGPDWTTSTTLQYARELPRFGALTLAAEHLYQGALGGDLSDDPRNVSDTLALINVSAALVFGRDQRWNLRLGVDNVLDAERVVERRETAAPGLLMLLGFPPDVADSTVGLYNAPRTWALTLAMRL